VWLKQPRWDDEADVVVVGFGGAGAVAAMTAHDAGREVLILEKQRAAHRFPSTLMSGGSIVCPSDPDAAYAHMTHLAGDQTGAAVLRAWADRCAENVDWVAAHGGTTHLFSPVGEHHSIPGYEAIQSYRFGTDPASSPRGYGLFRWLQDHVQQRGVPVSYGTAARWLLTDAAGAVIGVQCRRDGATVNVRARRAVILTTGGFEFHDALKRNHLPVTPTHFYASPDNTGDGVVMAQEVGAALWHMSACSAKAIAKFDDFPTGFPINPWGYGDGMTQEQILYGSGKRGASCGTMQVDRFGRRFTNEVWKQHTHYYELTGYDSHRGVYPRVPTYWIFDSARMRRGQLVSRETGAAGPLRLYPWSEDNQAELARGWITRAETIEGLADRLAMEPAVLRGTLAEYNAACETGRDPFGRPADTLVGLEPPFFAVKLWPGGPNTQGGPERDARARVMRVTGEPVPRLYAAGELGSVYGTFYPIGGANLAECIAFGRIAGENASAEAPYSPR
jgi:succinate dehydrogenase/fumarate reductase flavoprotein subunit